MIFYNIHLGLNYLLQDLNYLLPHTGFRQLVAVAGRLAAAAKVPASAGTFPTRGPLWIGLLIGVIVIVGGLTFFPALALGPLVEQFAMQAADLF